MPALLQTSARISHSSEIFGSIADERCNLAIWRRSPVGEFDTLLTGAPDDLRFTTPLGQCEERLSSEMLANEYSRGRTFDVLVKDVGQLARLYCNALHIQELEVRLERVTTNSCRKFHADYVSARLITTYVGAGTQWLEQEDARRVKEGLEPRRIMSLEVADVGLFKGKLATEEPAIHRSPPIEGTGQQRLLLVLNPPPQEFK